MGYRTVLREDDGPALHVANFRDDQDLVNRVLASVAALMEEGYEADDITILVPTVDNAVARMLDVERRDGGGRGRGTTPVHTVQAFKGLESPAVVLAGIEDVESEYWRSVLYVGITRARHAAHVLVDASVRQQFDSILKEVAA
jgi:superfamily I DNA/RNA helicase